LAAPLHQSEEARCNNRNDHQNNNYPDQDGGVHICSSPAPAEAHIYPTTDQTNRLTQGARLRVPTEIDPIDRAPHHNHGNRR